MMKHRDFRIIVEPRLRDLGVHDMSRVRGEEIRARCLSELRAQREALRIGSALRPVWNAGLIPTTLVLGTLYLAGVFWNALALFR